MVVESTVMSAVILATLENISLFLLFHKHVSSYSMVGSLTVELVLMEV